MASISDRLKAAIKLIVREEFPDDTFTKVWRYSVASFNVGAQTADLQPVSNQKLPYLEAVPIRLPNIQCKLVPGDTVLIGFEGGSPTAPYVASLDYASSYASALAMARQGDMTITTMVLVPAIGPAGPIPNVYSITIPPPGPPPPFVPGTGGPASFVGIVSTGSVFNKSK